MSDFTPANLSADDTSLEAAQANVLASAKYRVAFLNAQLNKRWMMQVLDWNANMSSGTMSVDRKPPEAPFLWVLVPADGPTGFAGYALSETERATSPVPLATFNAGTAKAPVRDANHIDVGAHIGGPWYSAGPLDGTPNGFLTPPQDAVAGVHPAGIYEKFSAVVGAGWYQLQG